MPDELIPRGLPTCDLLAYLILSKFCYHLPLNRLERMFTGYEFKLSRGTMFGWFSQMYELISMLLNAWHEDARTNASIIGIDATGLPVYAKE